ncbi:LXG domain-containing protein [Terribacillus sp. DMT04]|uniref:LXG domain-containing protein n=1 Tax=Terribacillus sp. DMT04 TaxID=2850441 RepID=UPI001C2BB319|nr:LXG domain-containing protein [Terribacillus sp. DMT04]QXE01502.1 LXG domain-containing protein [Terribacillus sp. DMT04]
MKAIKNIDVQDIQQQVDSTKKFINKTKEGVEQVKQALNGITTLNDGFKGKTADSIRSFYEETHKPFLEFMESFLVQYEEALSSVTEEVRSFESNEHGFIREAFLEDDLKAKLVKASTSLTSTTIDINQQLLHVRDIANVSSVKSDPFIEDIDKGKEKLSDTLSNMYDMDASATSKLDKPEDDIQQMKTYLAKLRNAIDKNNISVDSFNITQFKGEFFEYHDEFKLLAKGRNALATGDKAEITEQDFNELYPYKKDEIYVSDGHYEWHGRYYTLEDGRIVREYKHDTGGVSYEFVDKIPDPRAAPDNWFSKALKWTWDFFTEDIATIFDPEASAGEKIFALAMFIPIAKPIKLLDKATGGFAVNGVKLIEELGDSKSVVKKSEIDSKHSDPNHQKIKDTKDTSGDNHSNNEVYGPYYEEAKKLHDSNPDWYPNPDESSIVKANELKEARADYQALVRRGELEKGHHRQGLAFGGENLNSNIKKTGESTIRREQIDNLNLDFYHEVGYGKKDAKVLKIHENEDGIILFGNNPQHTEVTTFQNRVLKWQRVNGKR